MNTNTLSVRFKDGKNIPVVLIEDSFNFNGGDASTSTRYLRMTLSNDSGFDIEDLKDIITPGNIDPITIIQDDTPIEINGFNTINVISRSFSTTESRVLVMISAVKPE